MNNGWIKIFRDIRSHWIWTDANYLKWWLDILIEANHTQDKTLIKGKLLVCNRGEKLYSYDTWASRWGINKSKARRFINLLESDGMLRVKNETVTTRITVCNYDTYQSIANASETQVKRTRNASETQVTPIEELKNDKELKELKKKEFDSFWDIYDKKTGKDKCFKKWLRLKDSDVELIFSNIEKYIESTPDKKYRKDPLTYLNGQHWNDEIEVKKKRITYDASTF